MHRLFLIASLGSFIPGAAADTATVKATVIEAGVAVAGLIAEKTPEGKYEVHHGGVEEVVADKGYHSNEVAVSLGELGELEPPIRAAAAQLSTLAHCGLGLIEASAHSAC